MIIELATGRSGGAREQFHAAMPSYKERINEPPLPPVGEGWDEGKQLIIQILEDFRLLTV